VAWESGGQSLEAHLSYHYLPNLGICQPTGGDPLGVHLLVAVDKLWIVFDIYLKLLRCYLIHGLISGVWKDLATALLPSLRAKRSNPESRRGVGLYDDGFVAH
jgi:hypothetical protein